MNQTTMDSDTDIGQTAAPITPAPPITTAPALALISDLECEVSLIRGSKINSEQAKFEISLLALNPASAAKPTLALATPSAKFSLALQCAAARPQLAAPRSIALSAGLIAHGYVPDDWLCALITAANNEANSLYFTLFDSQGIYGRATIDTSLSGDNFPNLTQQILKDASPISADPGRSIEALYVDLELLKLAVSVQARAFEKLSVTLDILVEALPAPSSDLSAAGLRWLSAEVN